MPSKKEIEKILAETRPPRGSNMAREWDEAHGSEQWRDEATVETPRGRERIWQHDYSQGPLPYHPDAHELYGE